MKKSFSSIQIDCQNRFLKAPKTNRTNKKSKFNYDDEYGLYNRLMFYGKSTSLQFDDFQLFFFE